MRQVNNCKIKSFIVNWVLFFKCHKKKYTHSGIVISFEIIEKKQTNKPTIRNPIDLGGGGYVPAVVFWSLMADR